ncbi:MAG: DUF2207 domain-containing protein [Sphingomicrobium sp.]
MRGFATVLTAWLAAFALAPAAHAEERIVAFVSDVAVQPDAALDVTETIDVVAENNRINHGIFRDFPTRYRRPHGTGQVRVGFTFLGATLDGAPETAATEPVSNGVRIRVGSADRMLAPGEHRYVLHYRTTRQIARFADYDELYWNATGNGWDFPIDRAEARIRLPAAVKLGQRSVYTGAQGSTASDAAVVAEKPGEILFRTTRPLASYEGLTVAVAWPKGVIAEPGQGARAVTWLSDYGPPLVGALGLAGLLFYYWTAWRRAGRDPRPGTVVPLFSPPDDLSPAAMRYVMEMGVDNRAFAAALVDMGVRGHVRLSEDDGGWLSKNKRRIERIESATPLPADEALILEKLLSPGETLVMEQKNHAYFASANNALSEHLKHLYEGKMFRRNLGWAVAGAPLLIAAMWLGAAAVLGASGTGHVNQMLLALGAGVATAMLLLVIRGFGTRSQCVLTVALVITGGIALLLGWPVIAAALATGWWLPVLLPAIAAPLMISAFWWMSAPTREGRAVLDRIAGFRQYLSIAEGERLDRMTPPEDTPALFERFLPYAIALGVENRWADRFSGVLAAAAAQGQSGFAWYSGSSSPWSDTSGFVDSVGSSLTSTISSASTAPGSSSGSGGGGSSGGGGGGGGGGGW